MSKANPFGAKGWTPERVGNLQGKTYLITGGNAGAGYEAAKVFLSKAAVRVNAEIPQIDAFICNAAIAQVAKQELTKDGFESQLGTNHFGHFLLTNLIFNRLVQSKARIVFVGSNGHKMGQKKIQFDDINFNRNYNPHYTYCHSKFAQMMFAYELERRVKAANLPVSVHVCHLGAARTTLAQEEANWITKFLFSLLSPLAQSAERGAWPEVLCATEENLKPHAYYGPTKRAEMVGPIGECELEASVLDTAQASRLWGLSELLTGVSWTF